MIWVDILSQLHSNNKQLITKYMKLVELVQDKVKSRHANYKYI